MKTLSKKLLSMLLAVLMLVSVIPMTALADTEMQDIPVDVYINDEKIDTVKYVSVSKDPDAEHVLLNEELGMSMLRDTENRSIIGWGDSTGWGPSLTGNVSINDVNANENYRLKLFIAEDADEGEKDPEVTEPKPTEPEVTEPKPTEPEVTEPKPESKTINFWGLSTDGKKVKLSTVTILKGEKLESLPSAGKSWLKEFTGKFRSEDEKEIKVGTEFDDINRTDYYAVYNSCDASKDGLSKLTVKASLYSAGKHQATYTLFSNVLDDKTEILNWLVTSNDRINDVLASSSFAEGYERSHDFFYNYDGTGKLTEPDTLGNGDKTVYVKLNATDAKSAKVLLYVHSKVGDTAPKLYEMTGYVKNGEVTRSQVQSVIEKYYKTSSKTKIDGLYSKATWDQKVGGEKPTGVPTLTIDNSNIYEVHVVLTNATLKTGSGTADSTNPKTGDTIFMTVTVMAVSAMALAGAYVFNKKRMVK